MFRRSRYTHFSFQFIFICAIFLIALYPCPSESLFGLGSKSSKPSNPKNNSDAGAPPSKPSASQPKPGSKPNPPAPAGQNKDSASTKPPLWDEDDVLPPSTFYERAYQPDAWTTKGGEVKVIRAERDNRGNYAMPPGTIVPKDTTSMGRIISITNALGEWFHCLLPPRRWAPRPGWMDIPQVPVSQRIDRSEAEEALKALEGKCFYRMAGYWTYEFCYKKHVKQMRVDPHSKKVTQEILLGTYNSTKPFEVLSEPDRMHDVIDLGYEGPGWTTGLATVYGGGETVQPLGWYKANYVKKYWIPFLGLFTYWKPKDYSEERPRQVALIFKCLRLEDPGLKVWLEQSKVYLGKDNTPFHITVEEVTAGNYEIVLLSEALCESPLLYMETTDELSPFGDIEEEVVCQSETDGQVYKLKDVPNDDRFYHKQKLPWHHLAAD